MKEIRSWTCLVLALFFSLGSIYLVGTDYEKDVPMGIVLAITFLALSKADTIFDEDPTED